MADSSQSGAAVLSQVLPSGTLSVTVGTVTDLPKDLKGALYCVVKIKDVKGRGVKKTQQTSSSKPLRNDAVTWNESFNFNVEKGWKGFVVIFFVKKDDPLSQMKELLKGRDEILGKVQISADQIHQNDDILEQRFGVLRRQQRPSSSFGAIFSNVRSAIGTSGTADSANPTTPATTAVPAAAAASSSSSGLSPPPVNVTLAPSGVDSSVIGSVQLQASYEAQYEVVEGDCSLSETKDAPKLRALLLKHFAIPADELILEAFSCRLRESRLLRYMLGRLFVTGSHVIFCSTHHIDKHKMMWAYRDLQAVKKANTAKLFPSAIDIILNDGRSFRFSGFTHRDTAFDLIQSRMSAGSGLPAKPPVDQSMFSSHPPKLHKELTTPTLRGSLDDQWQNQRRTQRQPSPQHTKTASVSPPSVSAPLPSTASSSSSSSPSASSANSSSSATVSAMPQSEMSPRGSGDSAERSRSYARPQYRSGGGSAIELLQSQQGSRAGSSLIASIISLEEQELQRKISTPSSSSTPAAVSAANSATVVSGGTAQQEPERPSSPPTADAAASGGGRRHSQAARVKVASDQQAQSRPALSISPKRDAAQSSPRSRSGTGSANASASPALPSASLPLPIAAQSSPLQSGSSPTATTATTGVSPGPPRSPPLIGASSPTDNADSSSGVSTAAEIRALRARDERRRMEERAQMLTRLGQTRSGSQMTLTTPPQPQPASTHTPNTAGSNVGAAGVLSSPGVPMSFSSPQSGAELALGTPPLPHLHPPVPSSPPRTRMLRVDPMMHSSPNLMSMLHTVNSSSQPAGANSLSVLSNAAAAAAATAARRASPTAAAGGLPVSTSSPVTGPNRLSANTTAMPAATSHHRRTPSVGITPVEPPALVVDSKVPPLGTNGGGSGSSSSSAGAAPKIGSAELRSSTPADPLQGHRLPTFTESLLGLHDATPQQIVRKLVLSFVAILLSSILLPAFTAEHWKDLIEASGVLAVLSLFLQPVLWESTRHLGYAVVGMLRHSYDKHTEVLGQIVFPIAMIPVVNTLLLLVVVAIVRGFHVSGLWGAFYGSFLMKLTAILVEKVDRELFR